MTTLRIDGLDFEVRYSAHRKTLQITVDRGGELILSAPIGTDASRLRAFVRDKRSWIYTKLAERDTRYRGIPKKEFVSGEGFLYLGRSYRLKLVDEQDAPLKLVGGRFRLRREELEHARKHFISWYSQRGREWLSLKVAEHALRMELQPVGLTVQDLGYRWGSCGKGNRLYFHWKTMLLPRPVAEYVVIHELAHLHEPHHTPGFWRRVERALPDFGARKAWLGEHGLDVEGL